jgi:predicted nucleic acid-binding Zn ribbon protein
MTEPKGKHACSGKCRAVLSRRRKVDRLNARDQEIRGLLEAALHVLVAKS